MHFILRNNVSDFPLICNVSFVHCENSIIYSESIVLCFSWFIETMSNFFKNFLQFHDDKVQYNLKVYCLYICGIWGVFSYFSLRCVHWHAAFWSFVMLTQDCNITEHDCIMVACHDVTSWCHLAHALGPIKGLVPCHGRFTPGSSSDG